MTIRIADLFCGAGGTSTGALDAVAQHGFRPELTAVNHWETAVATHSANHPDARHVCAAVDSINPRHLYPDGRLDILWASPECTHHSRARGGKPMQDQSRATAWCVTRWAEALRPPVVFVENVPEFAEWGPLGANGKPLKSRKGETFQAWLTTLRSLGYRVEHRVLCAADYGDPTTRSRLFVQAVRGKRRIVWPEPTHAPKEATADLFGTRAPWRAAREIIDWQNTGTSIFERKRPLRPKTMQRIMDGLRRYGLSPSLVCMEHGGRTKPVSEPVPTITTARGGAFGLAQPFLVNTAHGGQRAPSSIDAPLPTVCGNRGDMALVEPFIITLRGTSDRQCSTSASSADWPLGTVSAGGIHHALIQPFLVEYYGTGTARSVNAPFGTLTTKPRFGLAMPEVLVDGQRYRLDIRFRMLTTEELSAAQGFPVGYRFTGTKTEAIRQIGNAVPCGLARALVSASLAANP